MRNTIFSVFVVPLLVMLAAQTAAASEHHHTGAWARSVATKQFRNTNAYAPRSYIAVQPNWSGYTSDYTEGAMTSGIAGH
jgi:hypothetical protein